MINKAVSKSCDLDPIPTWLLKSSLDILSPSITNIVNLSLSNGVMPDQWKRAIVTPLLKKANLDHEILKNFRPVSNLAFISKLVEKVVAVRLQDHMTTNGLDEPPQSAYKPSHRTETSILLLTNIMLSHLFS